MRESAQRECVLVCIIALQQQFANEVSTANVMLQVAEFSAAEWVVAQSLDDDASVSIGVRLCNLLFRQAWKSLQKQWAEFIGPYQIYDFLVGEHGVRE